jgi:hypothetical protein
LLKHADINFDLGAADDGWIQPKHCSDDSDYIRKLLYVDGLKHSFNLNIYRLKK